MIKIIINKILKKIASLATRLMINEYTEFLKGNSKKRALVSYLVLPLFPPPRFRNRVKFSNRGLAQEIPRCLNDLGYVTDIVNFDNSRWVPKRKYDLFIGHGGVNYKHISEKLPKETVRIYFSTGIYWKKMNKRLAKRLFELALRKNYLFPPERFIKFSEEYANKNANGIICLGNRMVKESYAGFEKVLNINNAIYPIDWEGWKVKDFNEGKRNFLFFSGKGNIQKGLDLLIEAFLNTDLHLHICQHMQKEFLELYKKEIYNSPNIHLYGFIRMRSKKFQSLAKICNWVISATCSEGQPGSLIECMGYGLIPILPRYANIDLENFGVDLPSCNIADIKSRIKEASEFSAEECYERTSEAVRNAQINYSIERFRENFKRALTEIIAEKKTHM